MEFKDLLTTYWSQMTLVLVGIGYLIKRGFDLKSKKQETNHTIYQQNRLIAINRFFESYAKAEQMWSQIAIYDILSRKFQPKEIDKLIFPTLNKLKSNLLELMIYFEEDDYTAFKIIVYNIESINRKLSELYFDYDPKKTDTEKSGEFELVKSNALLKNEQLLFSVTKVIKTTFKS